MPKFVLNTPDGRKFKINAPEGMTEDEILQRARMELGYESPEEAEEEPLVKPSEYYESMPVNRTLSGAAASGFSRGASRLGSLVTDVAPALLGSAFGFDDYARGQMEEAAAKEAALQQTNPAQFQSFRDVSGLGEGLTFLSEKVGEQIPNLLTSVGTGGAGAILGGTLAKRAATAGLQSRWGAMAGLPAGKEIAQQAAAAGAASGAGAGAFAGSAALNIPEVFQNIYEKTGELAPVEGLLFGAGAAALDSILPARILKSFRSAPEAVQKAAIAEIAKRKGFVPAALGSLTKNIAIEGATEGSQEAISIMAEQFVDDTENFWGQPEFDRIMESVVVGGVTGGGISVPTAVMEGLRQRKVAEPVQEAPGEGDQEFEEDTYQARQISRSTRDQLVDTNISLVQGAKSKEDLESLGEKFKADRTAYEQTAEGQEKPLTPQHVQRFDKATADKIKEFSSLEKKSKEAQTETDIQELMAQGYTREKAAAEINNFRAVDKIIKPVTKGFTSKVAEKIAAISKPNVTAKDIADAAELDVNKTDGIIVNLLIAKKIERANKPGVFKNLSYKETFPEFNVWLNNNRADIQQQFPELDLEELSKKNPSDPSVQDALGKIVPLYEKAKAASAPTTTAEETTDIPPPTVRTTKPAGKPTTPPAEGTTPPTVRTTKPAGKPTPPPAEGTVTATTPTTPPPAEGTTPPPAKKAIKGTPKAVRRARAAKIAPKVPTDISKLKADLAKAEQELDEEDLKPGEMSAYDLVEKQAGRDEALTFLAEDLFTSDFVTGTKNVDKILKSKDLGSKRTHFEYKGGKQFWDNLSDEEKDVVRYRTYLYKSNKFDALRSYKDAKKAFDTHEEYTGFVFDDLDEQTKIKIAKEYSVNKSLDRTQVKDILKDVVIPYSKRNGVARAAFLPDEKTAVYAPGVKGKELRALRMHEVGAHYSIARMVGEDRYAQILKDLSKIRDGSKIVQKAYASAKVAGTPAKLMDHEALAYLMEHYEQMPIIKRLLQMVKDFFAKTFGSPITPSELRATTKAAMKKYGAEIREVFLKEGTVEDSVKNKNALFSKSLADSNELASNGNILRERITNTVDRWVANTPTWGEKHVEKLQGFLEAGVGKNAQKGAISLMGVMDLADFVRKYSPEIADEIVDLHKVSALRDKKLSDRLQVVEDIFLKAKKTVAKFNPKIVEKFNDLTNASTLEGVILDAPKEDEYLPENMPKYDPDHPLVSRFNKLPKELRDLYSELRRFYATYSLDFIRALEKDEVLSDAGKLLNKLFSKSIVPYFPLYRTGDFWLAYVDPETNTEAVEAFEYPRDRRARMRELIQQGADQQEMKEFLRTEDISVDTAPTREFRNVIALLEKNNVDRDTINSIYRTYLDLFPNKSVMGQFKPRKGTIGFLKDPVQVFSDVGTRFAMNAAQFEAHGDIDKALNKVIGHATDRPEDLISMVVNSVKARAKYIRNPTPSTGVDKFAAQAGYISYLWYIAGNISSALINLTQLPIVTYGLLAGKYGMKKAADAMSGASRMYFGGGWDNNTSMSLFDGKVKLNDFTFGENKNLPKEYMDLYRTAVDRGAIRRSTGQDLRAQRGKPIADPTSKWTRGLYALGWMFQNTERFNREVTLLATYKLARKKLNHEGAMEEAIRTVEASSGSSMSELGPQLFQHGFMRMVGTFKRFALSQVYLIYKLASRAFGKEVDPDIRSESIKQLLAIHTMAFAFAGLKGMPVFGLANVLASLLAGLIPDDEDGVPFDFDDFVMNNLGYSLYRGPISALLNIDIGSRTGFGDLLWRPDERRLEEIGLAPYIFEQAIGPIGGIAKNAWKGYGQLQEGEWMRGVETMSPSVVRNILKAFRFASEGVLDSKGEKIIEDVNAWNIFNQILGATPNDLAEMYMKRNQIAQAEDADQAVRESLFSRMYMARRPEINDYEEQLEIWKDIAEYNNTKLGRAKPITQKDVDASFKIRTQIAERKKDTFGISTSYTDAAGKQAFMEYVGMK